MLLLRVSDLAGTHAVAAAIAGLARAGDVIVLAGEMGAGKTAFAQGFGRALGITEPITSPTFTLVHSYPGPGKLTLHHADLYRLDRSAELEDLALHELAAFGGVVLVEWGDVVSAALGDHLEVRLTHPDDVDAAGAADAAGEAGAADAAGEIVPPDDEFADDGTREIELHATGASWAGRWDRLTRAVETYRC
jgi:tRNA threonylcarbamoyladenosine biosynthesis protein TsaE